MNPSELIKKRNHSLGKSEPIVWNLFVNLQSVTGLCTFPTPSFRTERLATKDRFPELSTAMIYTMLWGPLRWLLLGTVKGPANLRSNRPQKSSDPKFNILGVGKAPWFQNIIRGETVGKLCLAETCNPRKGSTIAGQSFMAGCEQALCS